MAVSKDGQSSDFRSLQISNRKVAVILICHKGHEGSTLADLPIAMHFPQLPSKIRLNVFWRPEQAAGQQKSGCAG